MLYDGLIPIREDHPSVVHLDDIIVGYVDNIPEHDLSCNKQRTVEKEGLGPTS